MNLKREICNGELLKEFEGVNQLYYKGKLWDIKVVGQIIYLSRMATPRREEEVNFSSQEALDVLANQDVEKVVYDNTPKPNFMKHIENQESPRAAKFKTSKFNL